MKHILQGAAFAGTVLFLAALMALPVLAGPKDNKWKKGNGRDAFREVVVECLMTSLRAGAEDPVAIATACGDATTVIWNTSYPPADAD